MSRWLRYRRWLLVGLCACCTGCFSSRSFPEPDRASNDTAFNQAWLESRWQRFREQSLNGGHGERAWGTAAHAGIVGEPCFDSPKTVLLKVLRESPEDCVVWPSERYWYFQFADGPILISGNLRFVDIEQGILHIGYFDADDTTNQRTASFGLSEGVAVNWDESSRVATVAMGNLTRRFQLDSYLLPAPRIPLFIGERLVSRVQDESGHSFILVFLEGASQFYYLLEPGRSLPERIVPVKSSLPIEIGMDSRFVFLLDSRTNRRTLVGVLASNIRRNNYFDGPFDQVPPRLPLRDRLERAYPYVALRGGVDEYGNFNHLPGQRVAISPYQAYESLPSLVAWLQENVRMTDESPWLPAVFESKSLFHLRLVNTGAETFGPPDHLPAVSRSWPANHWGDMSLSWPGEHDVNRSQIWPPNHETNRSVGSISP